MVSKAVELIKKTGRPMHVKEILEGIGKKDTKKERVSLSSSLGMYYRKNEIFTRPAPNTFGLISMEVAEEPPDDFGLPTAEDTEKESVE